MRRTKIASRKFRSGAVEASLRQISRDLGFPFRVAGGLLHDKPFCAGVEPDAEHFRPQTLPGSLAVNSGSDACALAGRAANDDVRRTAGKGSDIVVDGHAGKMVLEQPSPPWLDLNELHGSEVARGVKAEGVSADVAEKVEGIHFLLSFDALAGSLPDADHPASVFEEETRDSRRHVLDHLLHPLVELAKGRRAEAGHGNLGPLFEFAAEMAGEVDFDLVAVPAAGYAPIWFPGQDWAAALLAPILLAGTLDPVHPVEFGRIPIVIAVAIAHRSTRLFN